MSRHGVLTSSTDHVARRCGLLLVVAGVLTGCQPSLEPVRTPPRPLSTIDRPAPNERISGKAGAYGWAFHLEGPVRRVDLLLDGKVTGSATYGVPRPDVCRLHIGRPGCPNVGWQGAFNASRLTPGEHSLALRIIGPSGQVFDTPARPILIEGAHQSEQVY
jgi:hypothetical protein